MTEVPDPRDFLSRNEKWNTLLKYAKGYPKEGKRMKAWITGSYNENTDSSKAYLNFLFEGEKKMTYKGKTFEGILVKKRFVLETNKPLDVQVNQFMDKFYGHILDAHFLN